MFDDLTRSDVRVPDGRITVWSTDRPGTPVVFLHGGGLDHRSWRDQVTAFGERHRVVLVDARGHGESSTPTGAYRHCDDLAAVLAALDLGPAVVVGLSMGGGTATDLALEHPEHVAGLVVSGTGTSEPTFTDPWVLDVFAEWKAAEETRDPQRWMDAFLRFVPGPFRALDDVDPEVVERVHEMGWHTLQHHAIQGFAPPTPVTRTWERVPYVTVPVVVASGSLDSPDHIDMGHRLAEAVPDGSVVDIPDTAHYPNLERPADFDTAVELLISRVRR
jgi:pimeloyl-ACP methyl ester carboxylesterase